jgi:fatty-acyl-CoA synthase
MSPDGGKPCKIAAGQTGPFQGGKKMRGLMQDRPLTIQSLIAYAAQYHGDTAIASRTTEGELHRYTYADAERRAKQLAKALKRLGIGMGDRVATIAWNNYRHFELYFGISGIGAVCHTINPRLFADQLRYIVNHAEDKALFVDLTFVPLVEKMAAAWPRLEHYVIMTDRAHMPETSLKGALCYEELVAGESADFAWPDFDENTASSLCYTSGTTGNPKGALYTHRSTLLHSYAVCSANAVAISMRESICPIVPMFHVNAWGIPYAAAMSGAKLVFPGPRLDGASLFELFETERVTLALGVPTVWLGLLQYLEQQGKRLSTVRRVTAGGAAVPLAMIKAFAEAHGIECIQGWGMTEMSPVGSLALPKAKHLAEPKEAQFAIRATAGLPLYGVEVKVVGPDGTRQPHDGQSSGELLVRGPWVIGAYFADEAATEAAFDEEGWFRTGDVVTVDPDGFIRIVDRSKDVIKSGGEWISTIDLENAAMGHPDVAEAAVIGVRHPKWDERPLLIIVPKQGRAPDKDALTHYLGDKVAKWQLPDDIVFVPEIPHGATGKVLKTRLRELFQDHKLPTV